MSAKVLLKRTVLWESSVFCALCLLDVFFTILVVNLGIAREGNPVMAFYLNHGVAAFVAVKSLCIIGVVIAVEYLRIKNPAFATYAMRIASLGYLAIYVIGDLKINHLL